MQLFTNLIYLYYNVKSVYMFFSKLNFLHMDASSKRGAIAYLFLRKVFIFQECVLFGINLKHSDLLKCVYMQTFNTF